MKAMFESKAPVLPKKKKIKSTQLTLERAPYQISQKKKKKKKNHKKEKKLLFLFY